MFYNTKNCIVITEIKDIARTKDKIAIGGIFIPP